MRLRNGKPGWILLCCAWLLAPLDIHSATIDTSREIASLLQVVAATNETSGAKIGAIRSLERLGLESAPAAASLVDLLINKSEMTELRLAAISALKYVPGDERTIPAFLVVLRDKKEVMEIRRAAFEGFVKLAPDSTVFINHFAKILQDRSEPDVIRDQAAEVLRKAVTAFANGSVPRSATLGYLEARMSQLNTVRTAFQMRGLELPVEVTHAAAALEKTLQSRVDQRPLASRLFSTPWCWIGLPALPPLLCIPLWMLLLWRSPIMLWKINRALQTLPEFTIKAGIDLPLSLRKYLLSSNFQYHPRVLDSWLAQFRRNAARGFNALNSIAERSLHIPVPVAINGLVVEKPSPGDFRELFRQKRSWITIRGEAGSGKTSFACQIARWATADRAEDRLADHWIMPVFVSEGPELPPSSSLNSFMEAVAKQVRTLCNITDELSSELLHHLLEKKRLLVIADGLDASSAIPQYLESACGGRSPINALVITSRINHSLAEVSPTDVETNCLQAEALPLFVSACLQRQGKRSQWEDREFLKICLRFIEMLDGRGIPALWARLFAERLADARESGQPPEFLASIPDLVSDWVGGLNQKVASYQRMADTSVCRLASAAGWSCLEPGFRLSAKERGELVRALEGVGGSESDLAYLQHMLGLLRPADGSPTRLSFGVAVLAEYLAALHATASLKSSKEGWRQLLAGLAKAPETRVTAKGFIAALRDCCVARGDELSVPEFVELELGGLLGLDPGLLERARLERRIDRLMQMLSSPKPGDREAAALELGRIGASAAIALPALIARLKDTQEPGAVRCAVIEAMGQIGGENEFVVSELVDCLGDRQTELPTRAARALARVGEKAIAPLIKLINDKNTDEDSRVVAVHTLGSLERDRPAALPALIKILRDQREAERVRETAAESLGRIGSPAEIGVEDLIQVMRESKSLCQSAAKALVAIAPGEKTSVIALAEALNPAIARNSKDILAALRPSLIQPEKPGLRSNVTDSAERIRRVLRNALDKVQVQHEASPRLHPGRAISSVS